MGTMPHAAFTCRKGANLLLGQALMQSVARIKLYLNSFNSRKITIFRNLRIIVIPGAKSTKTKFGSPPKYVWKAFSINPLWGHCQEYKIEKRNPTRASFIRKKEALLHITALPCLKAFFSLITKNKSKSSWHTERFAKNRLKEKSSGRIRTIDSAKTA